jgi:transglutaminase-like putative cysteine protease
MAQVGWGMSEARGWRIKTEHVTHFSYSDLAFASYNEVRVVPQSNNRQTRLEAKLATVPHAAQYTYWDYFGTQVVAFNIDQGHLDLQITSSSLVETQPPEPPPTGSWADIEEARDSFAEYLMPTDRTAPDAELLELAAGLRADSPTATIEAVMGWVHGRLEYVPGVTGVQTSAVEASHAGRGVCQDFAHLSLALLRAAGIPARYVSGYLHPSLDAEIGAEVAGESHAWIDAWSGSWWAFDPTNAIDVGVRHAMVARGRDYSDVPPVKGVYAGNADNTMSVEVLIARMG